MSTRGENNVAMLGFLEHVPGSWVLELIRCLPRKDKLSVFRTSRWLARHVVTSAGTLRLRLRLFGSKYIAQERESFHIAVVGPTRPTYPQERCNRVVNIAYSLMATPDDLEVDLLALIDVLPSLPETVASKLTSLTVIAAGLPSDLLASLPKITTLDLRGCMADHDAERLCAALHAGKLHHLRNFATTSASAGNTLSAAVGQKLVCALQACTHLSSIGTNMLSLLHDVNGFTALQEVRLEQCHVPYNLMKQLCVHPTVQDIQLTRCTLDQCISLGCGCKSVTLNYCKTRILSSIPLASIQQVIFSESLTCKDRADHSALEDAVMKHAMKLCCKAGSNGIFSVHGVCDQTALMVKQLMGCSELYVFEPVHQPSALKSLWQALPSSVTCISMMGLPSTVQAAGVDWTHFWDGMPTTVTHVRIHGFESASETVLAALVRTAPVHVQKLCMESAGPEVLAAREAAGLHAAAPAHLTLELA